MDNIIFKVVSSLQKIFPDSEPVTSQYVGKESVFKCEPYSFQIAFKIKGCEQHHRIDLNPVVISDVKENVTVKNVTPVACELASYSVVDDDYLNGGKSGLYPDIISEIGKDFGAVAALSNMWHSVWVEFKPTLKTKAGVHNITVEFLDENGISYGKAGLDVEVLEQPLAKQELIFTQWFHGDCIASYYNIEMLSDRHFELMESFIQTAVNNGINMLLIPLFTPPLDTKVGGERPTIQLVEVVLCDGKYNFNFEKAHRFIELCKKCGIEFFEMSHLFTQWGAKAAPKIMATVGSEYKRIFGWETDSHSEEYKNFLAAFMPKLIDFLQAEGISENTYFHVSDEPGTDTMDSYKAAYDTLSPYTKGFKMIDALSDYAFYEKGLVPIPIPASNHIKPFLEHDVKNLWTYYCCSQAIGVSNRFMSMPSARNRAIAVQLFKYDIVGFLHWGYNFYYSQYSIRAIDPFAVTDAGYGFPSGDAFSVYPGKDGALESIRLKVFMSAICDLRAMKMCSALIGKEETLKIIENGIAPIEFDKTPYNEDYVLGTRIRINKAIAAATAIK